MKLYQEALTRAAGIEGERSLRRAKKEEVERYRDFLESECPVVEEETRFLDHIEDLIVLGRASGGHVHSHPTSISPSHAHPHSHPPSTTPSSHQKVELPSISPSLRTKINHPNEHSVSRPSPNLLSLAIAIAAAVLVPILTFVVIPGFLGRMVVAFLVAGGIVGAIVQAGGIKAGGAGGTGMEMEVDVFNRDGAVCAGIYGIGMAIVACVVG